MGVEIITPLDEIYDYIEFEVDAFTSKMIEVFRRAGEEVVREAREKGSYTDQTGNLRSSIGYVLVYNGAIIDESSFEQVKSSATKGGKEGKDFAYELAKKYNRGLVIIVVAGMNYASYVSSKKDVLDSGELKMEELMGKISNMLKMRLK